MGGFKPSLPQLSGEQYLASTRGLPRTYGNCAVELKRRLRLPAAYFQGKGRSGLHWALLWDLWWHPKAFLIWTDAECYHRCPALLLVLPARACESTTLVLRILPCSGTLALLSLWVLLQQTLILLDMCNLYYTPNARYMLASTYLYECAWGVLSVGSSTSYCINACRHRPLTWSASTPSCRTSLGQD